MHHLTIFKLQYMVCRALSMLLKFGTNQLCPDRTACCLLKAAFYKRRRYIPFNWWQSAALCDWYQPPRYLCHVGERVEARTSWWRLLLWPSEVPIAMATDDSADMPESEEGTPTASEGSRSGKKAKGGKKSVAPLKIKLNKRKKKRNSSVSWWLCCVSFHSGLQCLDIRLCYCSPSRLRRAIALARNRSR